MNNIAWITWLNQRIGHNLIILISYFLLVVLPHEQVGLLTVKIFGGLDRSTYNLIISILSITILGIGIVYFFKLMKKHSNQKLIWFYLISTITFAVLCFKILFVVNIEFIHFIQYALFALLCFPLTLNYTHTLIWSTLAGAIDEAYQYFYLAPQRTNYYDFNDVIINLVGVAFGLIIIKILNPKYVTSTWRHFLKSPLPYFLLVLMVLISIAFATNILGLYPSDTQAQYLLVKEMPTPNQFWSTVHPNITYHIVMPFEGILIILALFLFYFGLENQKKP